MDSLQLAYRYKLVYRENINLVSSFTVQNPVCCMTENNKNAQERAYSYFFHISLALDCGSDLCGCYISRMRMECVKYAQIFPFLKFKI
jgi:hypothetical protein